MRLILIVLSLFSLSACTKVAFKVDDKVAAMKTGVFAPVTDGDGNIIPTTPGPSPTPKGRYPTPGPSPTATPKDGVPPYPTATPKDGVPPYPTATPKDGVPPYPTATPKDGATPTPSPTPPIGSANVPVGRHCSDRQTDEVGTNVASAATVSIKIYNSSDSLVCTIPYSTDLRSSLNAGYFSLGSCVLGDGQYFVTATAGGKNVMQHESIREFHLQFGVVTYSTVSILMDSNPSQTDVALPYHGTQCDSKASPLYIDFRKDTSQYDILSSPQDGVTFDILGANGKPAYTKSQISWFEKGVFGLLALPNSNGEVKNIDQLFGDNTLGPDGKFSSNGFTALAKHDSNGDKVIDRYDVVFGKLRLWFDFNRDGKADSRELKTLAEMKLEAIDLDYDVNFKEVDKYGNEIKFKSVVKFKSGKLRSIFDVWFKL